MEFHLPEPIRNLKDFFYHLGIVTLGILIALGLEQIVEAHHRAKIGRSSVDGFRRELIDNRERVNEILPSLPKSRAQIETEIAKVNALGDTAARAAVPIDYPDLHFLLMSSAAWDTAIAIQALYYIPSEDAKHFYKSGPPVLQRRERPGAHEQADRGPLPFQRGDGILQAGEQ